MNIEPQGAGPWPEPGQATGFSQPAGTQRNYYQAGEGPGEELARAQYQPQALGQPQWAPQPQAYPVPPIVVPKNGAVGVLLSFFIPGLGSIVNGSVGMGLVILAADFVSWLLVLVLIGIPLVFAVWIWGMIDGYLSAQRWNRAHGIIS